MELTPGRVDGRVLFDRLRLRGICEEAIAEVNPNIAPAELTGWAFDHHDDYILEFYAKWGLLRFSVFVAIHPLIYADEGKEKAALVERIMREAPNAMADALGRAARDAAQEQLSLLNTRVERVEGRVTAIEGAANDRDEAESEARRGGRISWKDTIWARAQRALGRR